MAVAILCVGPTTAVGQPAGGMEGLSSEGSGVSVLVEPAEHVEKGLTGELPARVQEAIDRLAKGSSTDLDRRLLASRPSYVAAADAAAPVITGGASREPAVAGLAAGVYCRAFSGWVDAKSSISGTWLNRWVKVWDVCYNGTKVTLQNARYYYVTNRDFSWHDRGLRSDSLGSFGNWSVRSYMRGEMEQCLLAICTTSQYPYVDITAYGNGTASFKLGRA